MSITVVVITKNAEKTILNCIKSVKPIADEIIIIDSGSVDKTLEIAKNNDCKIIATEWLGYGPTKNIGHKAAKSDYILSIDADEALSADLTTEILNVKNNLQGLYIFKRLNNYCGKWIKYGAWYPDKKIRLFPKKNLWNDAKSHEQLIIPRSPHFTYFKNPLLHYAYRSKAELKQKTHLYADLGATGRSNYNKKKALIKMIFSPLFGFFKSYLLKLGFLDGIYGLEISYFTALGTFLKYKQILIKPFNG